MIKFNRLIWIGAVFTCGQLQADWEVIGEPGCSAGNVSSVSLVLDNGVPFVAYADGDNDNKASVMQFKNGDWTIVGRAGFSAAEAAYISLDVDNHKLYVAYKDFGDIQRKATVMKWDNHDWTPVGTAGFTAGSASFTSLVVDKGIPIVAYWHDLHQVSVMRFAQNSWQYVGGLEYINADEARDVQLALGSESSLFVAYQDWQNSRAASVQRFEHDQWYLLGSAGFSAGRVSDLRLALDHNIPFVAYRDESYNGKLSVMRFKDNRWDYVGSPGFSAGGVKHLSLAMHNGQPFVAFADAEHADKASVVTFEQGQWVEVGRWGFSAAAVLHLSLAFDGAIPVLAYADTGQNNQLTVMRFVLPNDSDADGVADDQDICEGGADHLDTDQDGVPNACDLCAGYHDDSDANGNGIADGCEAEEINLPAKTTTQGDAIVGLLPLPPSIHMTVKIAGRGAGRVRSTPPGIHYTNQSSNCTQRSDFLSHCLYPYAAHSAYFDTATWVTLHAEAAPGSVFLGWGGDLDCADGVIWTLHNTVCIAYFQN